MLAFHSCWTKPFKVRNPNKQFNIPPFELLTTILSALTWRKHNGSICMICDKTAYDFYKNNNLTALWDSGIKILLDDIPSKINPHIFWACGKLFALKSQTAPCVMLDTDFIVWEKLSFDNIKIGAIHSEPINPQIYPSSENLSACKNFNFSDLDWNVPPANTALSFFGDNDFTKLYTETAINFMLSCENADNPLTYMVFAEQRLLSMLAKRQNIDIKYFSNLDELFISGQKKFTHTWGFKQQMLANNNIMNEFCTRCAKRIMLDFKDWTSIISSIPSLSRYFNIN